MNIVSRALPILVLAALLAGCAGSQEQASQEQSRQREFTIPPPTAEESGTATEDATSRTVAAAEKFLGTLDDAQRKQVSYAFDSSQKSKWTNLPVSDNERNGVLFGNMTEEQRQAAMGIFEAALSKAGYEKTVGTMEGDETLASEGGGGGSQFGINHFAIAIFGTPSPTDPWMVQLAGHHLALNLTLVGKDNVLTPSFVGIQPSEYTLEGQTARPMGAENDKAFKLMNVLDSEQQDQAILNYEISDVVLGPGEDGRVLQPEGIPASKLNADQQALLLDLAREWVGRANDKAAAAKMSEIEDNLSKTYFAWSGPTTNGEPIYYRITGPTLHIEFSHQAQPPPGGVLHVHSIYRDPTNEYGDRLVS